MQGPTLRENFLAGVTSFIGVPYVWGGDTPAGFDCSGLAHYTAGELGVDIPRVSQDQYRYLPETRDPQPGDLVFFDTGAGNPPDHVGVVASPGGGTMIDAPHAGAAIRVESVDGFGQIMGYRSLPGAEGAATAGITNATLTGAKLPNLNPLDAVGDQIAGLPAAFLKVFLGEKTLGELMIRSLEVLGGGIALAVGVVMFVKVVASGDETRRASSGARSAAAGLAGGYVGARRGARKLTSSRPKNSRSGPSPLERSRSANTAEIRASRGRPGGTFTR